MSLYDFLSSHIWVIFVVFAILVTILLVFVVAFLQGREISLYPPKIGARPKHPAPSSHRDLPETLTFNGYGIVKVGYFAEFHQVFRELIPASNEMLLYFIHSRRWRETHSDLIDMFLAKKGSRLTVILPNVQNERLMMSIREHFEDGEYIGTFVRDAYRYFADILRRRPQGIDIRLSEIYPVYSFYRFDNSMIVAMYHASTLKGDVPTFQIIRQGKLWAFFEKDIQWMLSNSSPLTVAKLVELINS